MKHIIKLSLGFKNPKQKMFPWNSQQRDPFKKSQEAIGCVRDRRTGKGDETVDQRGKKRSPKWWADVGEK